MESNTVGNRIKLFRQRAKLSQLDLEIELGASTGSISRIENNLTNPTKETLLKIAETLDLDFYEKVDLLGISYTETERYIPERYLNQKLTGEINLNEIINTSFLDYAYVKGKEYFIKECDSSLDVNSNEVFYIQNIHSWRKGYTEKEANARHVPKRIQLGKFARFLLNNCEDSKDFQNKDNELYRESRLIKGDSSFEYTLMIEQDRITVFLTEPNITAFTIKNPLVVNNARSVFKLMWEENK